MDMKTDIKDLASLEALKPAIKALNDMISTRNYKMLHHFFNYAKLSSLCNNMPIFISHYTHLIYLILTAPSFGDSMTQGQYKDFDRQTDIFIQHQILPKEYKLDDDIMNNIVVELPTK